jgi:hypothetical protein
MFFLFPLAGMWWPDYDHSVDPFVPCNANSFTDVHPVANSVLTVDINTLLAPHDTRLHTSFCRFTRDGMEPIRRITRIVLHWIIEIPVRQR